MKARFLLATTVYFLFPVPGSAQGVSGVGAPELEIALRKLTVLGSALYVAAHPDDENTAVISYLSKGRSVRTAYLSVTRGEGGQNLIGSEQGDLLGIIRTQELLAARRIDGGEQFFTSAIDFGYSKTSDETMGIWGREKILGDIVWVIRSLRPDVIMTRFLDSLGTHGNHTSSAILTREAFVAAGDSAKFPEQLKFVKPWRARRLVFNTFRFGNTQVNPSLKAVKMDVGTYSPQLGLSFTEIAGISRSMHKSQGFGAGQGRGTNLQYFEPTAGEEAVSDLFDGLNLTWSRVKGGETVGALLGEAERVFKSDQPAGILPLLLKAHREMSKLQNDPWVEVKRRELSGVILACAGVWVDALAAEYSAAPGGEARVAATALNRSTVPIILERIKISAQNADTVLKQALPNNTPVLANITVRIPSSAPVSQPYWLVNEPQKGSYNISDLRLSGQPENPPALSLIVVLSVDGESIDVSVPVRYRWVDPVDGEQYRPFVIVPPVSVNLGKRTWVFADDKEKPIRLTLQNAGGVRKGTVKLEVPRGWNVMPASRAFEMKNRGEESTVTFQVKPASSGASGEFRAIVEVDGQSLGNEILTIKYPHIPIQTLFPPARGVLVRVDLKRAGERIGYIAGSGDEIPAGLRQIGYTVDMLGDEDLEEKDLSVYDAIVAGVRAYNTRPKIRLYQQRLMDYVRNGGRYVVQYVTTQRGESENLGPYPFSVSRDRVTVEEAPVAFNDAQHRLLNVPNKITAKDFDGWIQERGLYFADKWDPKYETVLVCNDPGETPKAGGMLFARYGKGVYIYTGYAFFRQIPAGVPGAYRLFVNLISK